MSDDRWLERWMPLVAARGASRSILELGCGSGIDTATLAVAGHHVVAVDLSPDAIAQARARVPSCEFHCQDVRAPFPVAAHAVSVIVASLSLHYFPWDETLALVRRIRDALAPGGVLLCRLNSTNDRHHGAQGHPPIERNYYLVDGEPKRFFDRADVGTLFATGWRVLHLEENIIDRYLHPKAAWEVVVEIDV
jgi:SAM-dependent methyltransferase